MAENFRQYCKTRADFDAKKAEFPEVAVVFLEEEGKEVLWAHGKEYIFIPSNGASGKVLSHDGKNPIWVSSQLQEVMSYGVQWDINQADPHLTRVGNMSFHKTLPIQSLMRGCVYQPKNKKLMYWLDANDWSKKEDGTPSRLDGYDGEVMIYIPGFYIKSFIDGDKREVRISLAPADETWEYQPPCYIAAYRDTVLNTVPEDMGYLSTLPANSSVSVVNTESYCRGGGNNATYDSYLEDTPCRTQLGKPRTAASRATMRGWARNGGKEVLSYHQYKNILYWLYVIEYANFNSQEAYNAELTAEGYKQGGLGAGVTTINATHWNAYWGNSGYFPLTPCGFGNEFGNGTGVKNMEVVTPVENGGEATQTYNFGVPRWRGIDNPFGDIWHNVDGIIIDADADNHENNMNYVYACTDPSKYADSLNDGYVKVGEEIHQEGYTKLFDLGSAAHIIPNVMGGNTTQYKCDYHWVGGKDKTLRTLFLGGRATYGARAGLGSFFSNAGVSYSDTDVGFRSVCMA